MGPAEHGHPRWHLRAWALHWGICSGAFAACGICSLHGRLQQGTCSTGAFAACATLLRYFMVFLQVFYVVLFSLSCGVVVGLLFTLYIGCDIGVAPAGWWLRLWLPSSTAVAFACLRSLRGMPIPAPCLTFGVSGAALVAEGSLGPARTCSGLPVHLTDWTT